MELRKFDEFRFDQSPRISHLQFADDTLLVGKASYLNLWTLKAVVGGF